MKNSNFDINIEKLTEEYIPTIAGYYSELAIFIRDNTNDDYFNFDSLTNEVIEEDLRSNLDNKESVTYIAVSNNKPIGFISGIVTNCFLPISKIVKIGYISGAFVSSSYRNKGIMRRLEEHIVNFFKEKNIKYLELNVISKNIVGKKCWNKLGYNKFREQLRKKIL